MNMVAIGIKIRSRRESLNYSQEKLGELLGLKKTTISRYESGDIKSMDTDTAQKFAKALNCEPSWLVGWDASDTNSASDNDILEMLKRDPQVRMVAKMGGDLTDDGKRDLLKYAELLRNQRDRFGED